jgi:hypothetical protein
MCFQIYTRLLCMNACTKTYSLSLSIFANELDRSNTVSRGFFFIHRVRTKAEENTFAFASRHRVKIFGFLFFVACFPPLINIVRKRRYYDNRELGKRHSCIALSFLFRLYTASTRQITSFFPHLYSTWKGWGIKEPFVALKFSKTFPCL